MGKHKKIIGLIGLAIIMLIVSILGCRCTAETPETGNNSGVNGVTTQEEPGLVTVEHEYVDSMSDGTSDNITLEQLEDLRDQGFAEITYLNGREGPGAWVAVVIKMVKVTKIDGRTLTLSWEDGEKPLRIFVGHNAIVYAGMGQGKFDDIKIGWRINLRGRLQYGLGDPFRVEAIILQ